MAKTAVVIEDHQIYREALMVLVGAQCGPDNVAGFASAEDAKSYLRETSDIGLIFLDIGLPGIGGAEAVAVLRKACPAADIVVLSASEERREVDMVLRAGAKIFISKSVSNDVMSELIGKIFNQEALESNWYSHKGHHQITSPQSIHLTGRQQQILSFLCSGLGNKDIALRLNISEVTVKMHITAIFKTLGVFNRTQAVLALRRLQIDMDQEQ